MVMTAADMSVSKNSDTYLYALRHIICERRALSVKEGGEGGVDNLSRRGRKQTGLRYAQDTGSVGLMKNTRSVARVMAV